VDFVLVPYTHKYIYEMFIIKCRMAIESQ